MACFSCGFPLKLSYCCFTISYILLFIIRLLMLLSDFYIRKSPSCGCQYNSNDHKNKELDRETESWVRQTPEKCKKEKQMKCSFYFVLFHHRMICRETDKRQPLLQQKDTTMWFVNAPPPSHRSVDTVKHLLISNL